jgi:hypothetical protein
LIKIDTSLEPASLSGELTRLWDITGPKAKRLCARDNAGQATPVYTVEGRYTSRGWTEWTQGFLYGQAILQFDATGDEEALELGRRLTRDHMTPHLTHQGVHDHGFNNVSTYGNLRRLMLEGRIPLDAWELTSYENALRVSGAVQAMRWTATADGGGFIHSFNGPHSLFCDTIRSVRSLALAHRLGHRLLGENDRSISLLQRGIEHAATTATYNVFYGDGRDHYDIRGRVAHEAKHPAGVLAVHDVDTRFGLGHVRLLGATRIPRDRPGCGAPTARRDRTGAFNDARRGHRLL